MYTKKMTSSMKLLLLSLAGGEKTIVELMIETELSRRAIIYSLKDLIFSEKVGVISRKNPHKPGLGVNSYYLRKKEI